MPAAFVIPHGTATLEETAYFLNLALKTDTTVVLVGAQRPESALGSDAGMTRSTWRSNPAARGLGVLVALNGEIQSAREATKTSTYRLQAFRSPDFGGSGRVAPSRYLREGHMVAADNLNPQKARILLMLAERGRARSARSGACSTPIERLLGGLPGEADAWLRPRA